MGLQIIPPNNPGNLLWTIRSVVAWLYIYSTLSLSHTHIIIINLLALQFSLYLSSPQSCYFFTSLSFLSIFSYSSTSHFYVYFFSLYLPSSHSPLALSFLLQSFYCPLLLLCIFSFTQATSLHFTSSAQYFILPHSKFFFYSFVFCLVSYSFLSSCLPFSPCLSSIFFNPSPCLLSFLCSLFLTFVFVFSPFFSPLFYNIF